VVARRPVALLSALVLLAVPATALADGGAGDNQYQDPLVAPSAPKKKPKPAASAPAAAAPAASSSAPAPPAAAPAAAPAELPRTGGPPAGVVALAGALMVAAGLALRRRAAVG
jgi:hypothetical protein